MAPRQLDLRVERRGREVEGAKFSLHADPDDTITLHAFLIDWLTSRKWSPAMHGQFSLAVRHAGEGKLRHRISGGG